MPQGGELIVIVLVLVLLFGGTQVPKLARSLGQARKEFEKGSNEPVNDDSSPARDTKS